MPPLHETTTARVAVLHAIPNREPHGQASRNATGNFERDRLPDPISYFEAQGFPLRGPGLWRTARCDFHGGSDSLRINTRSGGWCCMACGAKGGDVLAFHMQHHGLNFYEAAKALDCWSGDAPQRPRGPADLSDRDRLELVAWELQIAWVILGDTRR